MPCGDARPRDRSRRPAPPPANAYKVIEAGANALVAGSAVFNSPDYAAAIAGIKASKAPK